MVGGLLALLAAVTFAFNNASARRGVLTGSISQAMAITVPIGVPMFFIGAVLAGSLGAMLGFSGLQLLSLCVAGIIHFVFGRYCNYRATKAIGANLVGPLQQTSLIITLAMAVLWLGEALTPLRLIGIILVVLGPMLTMRGDTEKRTHPLRATDQAETPAERVDTPPLKFEVRYAEGVVFALLSAIGYGTSPALVRYGIPSHDVGIGLAAGVISYGAATAVMIPMLFVPGWLRHALAVEGEAAKWFTISGVMVCVSQMFLYMGYAVAPVSVVAPIQRLSMVFRLYFGYLINPHHEVFGGKVYLGTVVSLVGALALSVSTDVVLAHVPLPDWAAAIARWHWP